MRKLGSTQMSVLRALVEYKGWSHRAGWVWSGPGTTERILKTLMVRGLVETVKGERGVVYQPTVDGRRAAERV